MKGAKYQVLDFSEKRFVNNQFDTVLSSEKKFREDPVHENYLLKNAPNFRCRL